MVLKCDILFGVEKNFIHSDLFMLFELGKRVLYQWYQSRSVCPAKLLSQFGATVEFCRCCLFLST